MVRSGLNPEILVGLFGEVFGELDKNLYKKNTIKFQISFFFIRIKQTFAYSSPPSPAPNSIVSVY